MKIIEPGTYLVAFSKTELRILRSALKSWKGPYHKRGSKKTPTEETHEREVLEVAADMLDKLKDFVWSR
jgi:hypothetical protein